MTDTTPPDEFLARLGTLCAQIRGIPSAITPTRHTKLDRDLGLDSLARGELIQRLEQCYQIHLPDSAMTVSTVEQLWALLGAANAATDTPLQPPPSQGLQHSSDEIILPTQASTLLEVLDWHARRHPQRDYALIHEHSDAAPQSLSFMQLRNAAARVAAGLQALGIQPGETVALMLPTGAAYFQCFFGCLLAGCVAIPLYPPTRPEQLEEHLQRHQRILLNANCRCLITIPAARRVGQWLRTQVPSLTQVLTPEVLCEHPPAQTLPKLSAEHLAFLQYTSGSTGDPKGVMLNHANLLANIRAAGERVCATPEDILVSWLPLYHDMGLIGGALFTLYYAIPAIILSPLSFLRRPISWLEAVDQHRATLSAAPNFAFERCLRDISPQQANTLDLSSWRYVLNGAEPVSADTMRRFANFFAIAGLRPTALAPSYGLAENTVALALPTPGRGLREERVDRDSLDRQRIARPARQDGTVTRLLVGCGHAIAGHQIRVVGATGQPLPDRHEGELEFCGPSATPGYYRHASATAALRHGHWWRSGDRGLLIDGEVFVTGRVKDMIIRHGRNLYPYDLEQAVGRLEGIRRGCVAVFSCLRDGAGEELLVAAETRETDDARREALIQQIQALASDWLDAPADRVLLVPPHTVLKTSSGKIRRTAMAELYRQQLLEQGPGHLRWQLLRLGLQALGGALLGLLRSGWLWLGRLRASLAIGVGALATGLLLHLLPASLSQTVARRLGSISLALAGIHISLQGIEHLRPPCLLVCKHASYLDGPLLLSRLPVGLSFIAKQELQNNPWLARPLSKLGVVFVERFNQARARDDAQKLVEIARSGRMLVVFPEGTFPLQAGVLPFRNGAFAAAVQAGVPVVPVLIRGSREVLPPTGELPRPGHVEIRILAAEQARGEDWAAIIELRERVRAVMVKNSGEPALEAADSPLDLAIEEPSERI